MLIDTLHWLVPVGLVPVLVLLTLADELMSIRFLRVVREGHSAFWMRSRRPWMGPFKRLELSEAESRLASDAPRPADYHVSRAWARESMWSLPDELSGDAEIELLARLHRIVAPSSVVSLLALIAWAVWRLSS